jgi:hydrogenase/urease accessory protein HupE
VTTPALAWLLCAALALIARTSGAHEIESASLSLREVAADRFLLRWQATSQTLQGDVASAVVFPGPCRREGAELRCAPPGLVGTLEFPWLEGTRARVLVDVEWQDGRRLSRVLTASNPSVNVYGMRAAGLSSLAPVARDYTWLGVEHILFGFDHLLFVVALAILVRSRRQLVATITAFTLAHSLSLAATVLGFVHVPAPPVEAAIALSIVLVCAECLQPRDALARAAPWAVAFAFGLLHGLGFASALLELGVPEAHVPAALVCFNLGVELGQLAIIFVAIGLERLTQRLRLARPWQRPSLVYAMGGIAAFWSLDRIWALFAP